MRTDDLDFHLPTNRRIGYEGALRDAGIEVDPRLFAPADFTIKGGYHAAKQLLGVPHDRPTAIFAASDEMAIGSILAARDLGASPLTAFATITLPIIQPTIIGAALIALSISLDDFVITFLTIGAGNTLPTMVWGLVRTSLDPTINALATLLIVLSIGSTIVALAVSRYRG